MKRHLQTYIRRKIGEITLGEHYYGLEHMKTHTYPISIYYFGPCDLGKECKHRYGGMCRANAKETGITFGLSKLNPFLAIGSLQKQLYEQYELFIPFTINMFFGRVENTKSKWTFSNDRTTHIKELPFEKHWEKITEKLQYLNKRKYRKVIKLNDTPENLVKEFKEIVKAETLLQGL